MFSCKILRRTALSSCLRISVSRLITTASTPALSGKTCLITGGSRGIGLAIASRLATDGASCILLSRTLSVAQDAASELDTSMGQMHEAVQLDVASTRRVWTADDLGGVDPASIDIVVNAAGVAQTKLLCLMTPEEIEDIVFTNLMGTIYSCRTFARSMMRSRTEKSILNISSVLSSRAGRGSSIYAACKGGIEGLTKALATELGGKRVRVNAIRPGLINTGMLSESVSSKAEQAFLERIPAGRTGSVEEVSDAAMFLIKNTYCNGAILTLDGGFSVSL
ncbi:hypothetical protein BZA70DRAFT_239819 [Myxozyma melibiosi]|uniref:Ketoreductase domain-containing protein n=1 Tax=Myxozyma melibiosi TaxID=54550 RepID=A0ABR1F3T4_9ASCO